MPIDMSFFRSLSREKQASLTQKLEFALIERMDDLLAIEQKIKVAMSDDTRPSDLGALLAYRDEVRKDLNLIRSDLDQIDRFNRNEEYCKPDPGSVASSISGAGVVNIRADDRKTRKVPGTKTYDEILEEKKKETEEEKEINEVVRRLLGEYKKVENSKKRTQTVKQ